MSMVRFWMWLIFGYVALALAPLVVAVVCDKVVIPFVLWLHRVGVLKAAK